MDEGQEADGDEGPFGNEIGRLCLPNLSRIIHFDQPVQNLQIFGQKMYLKWDFTDMYLLNFAFNLHIH